MSDDLTVLGPDGIRRSYDEHYDTMMDVEQDPTGAHEAIQRQHSRIEELEAENGLLRDAVYIDDLTVTLMAYDRITHHAKRWLNGPLPADLMADLADILDDEDYPPEKRVHQIVWQALKWMMENPVQKKETHND